MVSAFAPAAQDDAALYQFCTVDELAARLKRNKWTIYHQLSDEPEKLPRVTRLAGRVLFLERDIRAFMVNPPANDSKRRKWPQPAASTASAAIPEEKRRRGRPKKAEQARRAADAEVARANASAAAMSVRQEAA